VVRDRTGVEEVARSYGKPNRPGCRLGTNDPPRIPLAGVWFALGGTKGLIVVRRYLIVANQTVSGGQLISKVRELAEIGPCTFYIVVPATAPRDHAWTEAGARANAHERLALGLSRLRELGVEVDGEVGDEHPLYAVREVLERMPFDQIIVSTLHARVSRWLRADLVHRVEGFGLPVIHVEGAPEPVSNAR
jgi:GABA permease